MQSLLFRWQRSHRAGAIWPLSFFKTTLKLAWPLLALFFMLTAALPARASELLFLTPTEATPFQEIVDANAWNAFSNAAAPHGLTMVDGRGALSATTPLPVTADTKLIVAITTDVAANPARINDLIAVLNSRPDIAIVAFLDGCCEVSTNLQPFLDALNGVKPASWPVLTLGTFTTAFYTAHLNPNSLYQTTFADDGLLTFNSVYFTPITNVLPDYALYTRVPVPVPPPPTVGEVVGLFVPQTVSKGGDGACVFLTGDASEFDSRYTVVTPSVPIAIPTSQFAVLARTFIDAALDANGACHQPPAGAPDLLVELSEIDGPAVNEPFPVTVTVRDSGLPGVTGSADGQVDVTLSPGLAVSGPLPAGCAATATGFSCPLGALNPEDSVSFDFHAVAAAEVTDAFITAVVSNVTGEINTANNTAALHGITTPHSTPDLGVYLSGATVLQVGVPSPVTLSVNNGHETGVAASPEGVVEVVLPSDLKLASTPAGCAATATGFTCPVPPLAQGEDMTDITFEVIAPDPILASTSINAIVTVTGDENLANNTYALNNFTAIGSPDLEVTLAGAGVLPIGVPSPMTATVTNKNAPGVAPSVDGVMEVVLPGGLQLVSPPAGCAATATGFTCPVPALARGESAPAWDFEVIASGPLARAPVTAEVTWAAGVARHDALMAISTRALTASAIPTTSPPALALLALLLAGGAAWGWRRRG